jgi:hypothetical protein
MTFLYIVYNVLGSYSPSPYSLLSSFPSPMGLQLFPLHKCYPFYFYVCFSIVHSIHERKHVVFVLLNLAYFT